MTRDEKRCVLEEISEQAASVLRMFHARPDPLVDSAGNEIVPHDLDEIQQMKVVLGLTKLRKLVSRAIVDISDGEEGRP